MKIDHRLYLVTDDPSRYCGNWLDNVVAAVEGGMTCVQYRDTESDVNVRYERIRALQDALKGKVPLIVNNDAELARTVKAQGVHVGQSDMPVAQVRLIVGNVCEIGLSITALGQDASGADALGIGPVFDARKTKADASDAMGIDGLSAILNEHALPTVAIGGITLENAASVLATGVGGIAVVSAISKAEDPYERAKNLSMLFDHRGQ